MKRAVMSFVISGMVLASGFSIVIAQQKKEPPRRQFVAIPDSVEQTSSAPLPKIELPEFLITGRQTTDLPEFAKDPTDGSWMTGMPAEMPVGTRAESIPQLGVTQKDRTGLVGFVPDYFGKLLIGYGSYDTPFFDGSFGRSISSANFLLKADYKSSRGHVTSADYRLGHVSLGAGVRLGDDLGVFSGSRLNARIGLKGNSYRFYGSAKPGIERSVNGFLSTATVTSPDDEAVPRMARFSIESSSVEDVSRTSETSVGLELNGSKDISEFELKGDAGLWRSFYLAQSAQVNPFYARFAGSGSYRMGNSLGLQAGLSLYVFRGSDTRTMGRLFPMLGISWYADERVTVFARFEPTVQRTSLSDIVEGSPYVTTDVALRYPEQFTNFAVGAESEIARSIRARLSLNYTRTDNMPVFVDPELTGIWNIEYSGTTRVVSLDGEMIADITASDNLGLSMSIRSNRNSATSTRNPYSPLFVSTASYQHRFAFGLTTGGTLQIVGNRSTDLSGTGKLPAFTILNLKVEYVIIPKWSVFVLLNDILGEQQTWWKGYPGIERTASLGTNLTW